MHTRTFLPLLLLAAAGSDAQFDPTNGFWGKTDPNDVRVMTWNMLNTLSSQNQNRTITTGNWSACARIVAAMKPDVLIIQEAGDGDGVTTLETVIDLFYDGGSDPFLGGQVADYVTKFDPDYRPQHVFVSNTGDGFNRNVIISRFPFADLNGDGDATTSSFSTVVGSSGIRGIQFAELNLPGDIYPGDLVVSNAHLKAFGDANSMQQRVDAANALATYMWNYYNGAGTATPDPNNQVTGFLTPTSVLGPNTPIVWGGDYNEDELTNGRKGPVQISIENQIAGGFSDGTDHNGSDAMTDSALVPFSGSRATQSSSKLDWIMWQDSIATARNQFIFQSADIPAPQIPPEVMGFGIFIQDGRTASGTASDHRPVIVDFILPTQTSQNPPEAFTLTSPADGAIGVSNDPVLSWESSNFAVSYTLTVANDPALQDVVFQQSGIASPQAAFADLEECQRYYWSVEAENSFGSQTSTPAVATFDAFARADQNLDGMVNPTDFGAWIFNFNTQNPTADVNNDGSVDPLDFGAWLDAYNLPCDF